MRIAFIPIDNRPVCYNLAVDIAKIDSNIEFFIPPREYLGSLTRNADVDKIYEWFKQLPPACDSPVYHLWRDHGEGADF